MVITNEFREAVEAKKTTRVRIMLKDIMLVDPTMRQFDEMLNFAKPNISDLFDKHDGEKFKHDHNDWNESYLNNQMVKIISNFSEERIELLKKLVKYIYCDKEERINVDDKFQASSNITKKQVGIGITTVGVIATVAGVCAHQEVLLVAGVVVMAAGVGVIVTGKED